jgi:hypothetical protein
MSFDFLLFPDGFSTPGPRAHVKVCVFCHQKPSRSGIQCAGSVVVPWALGPRPQRLVAGPSCQWAGFTLSLGGVYVVIDVVPKTWSKEQVATGFW